MTDSRFRSSTPPTARRRTRCAACTSGPSRRVIDHAPSWLPKNVGVGVRRSRPTRGPWRASARPPPRRARSVAGARRRREQGSEGARRRARACAEEEVFAIPEIAQCWPTAACGTLRSTHAAIPASSASRHTTHRQLPLRASSQTRWPRWRCRAVALLTEAQHCRGITGTAGNSGALPADEQSLVGRLGRRDRAGFARRGAEDHGIPTSSRCRASASTATWPMVARTRLRARRAFTSFSAATATTRSPRNATRTTSWPRCCGLSCASSAREPRRARVIERERERERESFVKLSFL